MFLRFHQNLRLDVLIKLFLWKKSVADKVLDTQMYDSAEGESTPVDNNLKADEPSCNLKSGQLEYRPLFEDGSRAFLASGFNRGMEISKFDKNCSAIENLRSLTCSLEAMGSLYNNVS